MLLCHSCFTLTPSHPHTLTPTHHRPPGSRRDRELQRWDERLNVGAEHGIPMAEVHLDLLPTECEESE